MDQYRVTLKQENIFTKDVFADSEDEAYEKALEIVEMDASTDDIQIGSWTEDECEEL